MNYKLGKRPARKGAISFAMGNYFDRSALPVPPVRIGHEKVGMPWGMFANDKHSCCVFSGAAHEHMVWTHMGGRTVPFTDAGVLQAYSEVTGFHPNKPDTDNGTDMAQAAEWRRKVGLMDDRGIRHKVDAYVAPRAGDSDDLALLAYLTGGVGVGLMLPQSAMDQFDAQQPWDVPSQHSASVGGHYVSCIGRNSAGNFLVITWGRVHAMTPRFYERFSDEAVGYLSLAILKNNLSPEGFDADTLRAHIAKLGNPK